jgi:hypothetical protein
LGVIVGEFNEFVIVLPAISSVFGPPLNGEEVLAEGRYRRDHYPFITGGAV